MILKAFIEGLNNTNSMLEPTAANLSEYLGRNFDYELAEVALTSIQLCRTLQ